MIKTFFNKLGPITQITKINRGIIKHGYFEKGKTLQILGESINVNGMMWTPILFDDEEDPNWYKSDGIMKVT